MKMKRLMIVDGNSLVHRGFHAIPHLYTSRGEPTNGVFGFISIFLNALKKIQPDYIAVAFDLPGPTFRDELFKDYKATRVKAPQELYDQIPKVKQFVSVLGLPIFEKKGYEADDVIGTIAVQEKNSLQKIIVTGDLDTLQLVDNNTIVYTTKKGLSEVVEYNKDKVFERFGFGPEYVVDYKAIRGDPSDNIPGVRGVGEKGAIDLVKKFGNIENLYRDLEKKSSKTVSLSTSLKDKLIASKDLCFLSKKLAKINTEVPINFSLKETEFGSYDPARAFKFLQEMEFKSLLDKLPKSLRNSENQKTFDLKRIEANKKYHLISSQADLDKLVGLLLKQTGFVVDTETTSEKEMEAKLLGVSVCAKAGEAYYIPINKQGSLLGPNFNTANLEKLLADEKIQKWGHNLKYDFLVLRQNGINLTPLVFDTMIASYVLNPSSRGHGLDNLAFTQFGHQMIPIEDLIGKGKSQKSLAEVPLDQVSEYSCEDADYTFRLKKHLEPKLDEEGVRQVYFDIDLPLIRVLALMEQNGILVDKKILKQLESKVDEDLDELKSKIYKISKSEFNINSPLQLKEVLFNKLHISTLAIKKTKTGLSTAASELEKMKDLHPVIPLIVDYRELSKLKNTYLESLPELVNQNTGRIHTSFNQTIAATGRLSSTDPNLQNIPIRTELGNKIREAFVAEKGFQLLSCDYSQIELRVVAHLSGDKAMKKIFKEGKDIHTATAAEIFEIPESKVTANERRYAKVVNFGILYGLSAYGLTQQVPGVSRDKAQAFIDKYFLSYPGVAKYVDEIVKETRRAGWVANPLGRKRFLPEINSSQFPVRGAAERAAINTPIQSLAADIIKVAMINIANEIGVDNQQCRMLLQVHDELVFEVKKNKVSEYAVKMKKLMEDAIKLSVPVIVESKFGNSWGDMKALNL